MMGGTWEKLQRSYKKTGEATESNIVIPQLDSGLLSTVKQ